MRSQLQSPNLLTVWVVQPEFLLISKRKWTGDWSAIDNLLDNSQLETEHSYAKLFEKEIGLIYSCGAKNMNSNCGWRLRDDNFQSNAFSRLSNFSNLILTCVEKDRGLYDEDCPLSFEELVSRLDWVEYNRDLSKISYRSARLEDVESYSVNFRNSV